MSGISEGKLEVAVRTPPCVDQWNETVKALREKAEELRSDTGGSSRAAGVAGAVATGGALGNMLGGLASKADGAMDSVSNMAGGTAAMGVDAAADMLEKAIQTLEAPFEKVGKDVICESYTAFLATFSDYINNYKFANSLKLVRGEAPHEAAQYEEVKKRGITEALVRASASDIVSKVYPTCEESIKNSALVRAWDIMLDTNKSVCEQINKLANMSSALSGLKSLTEMLEATTDIPQHICMEIVLVLCDHMGAKEESLRFDSSGTSTHSKKDATFSVVFSGLKMLESHYNDFKR